MMQRLLAYVRGQRSQSMVEFALIAPFILLLTVGVVDFGRVIYYQVSLDAAVNEGARVAVRAPTPPNTNFAAPSDDTVMAAVFGHTSALALARAACVNGPIDSNIPPDNTGWVYITQPNNSSAGAANAPGGQPLNSAPAGCAAVVPAGVTPGQNNVPLQVTIRFNFVPLTPVIAQFTANRIVLLAYATYRTEY
ncbi:MAG: hypothetical protein NVS9B1_17940 [Candidatus Dormibacteraceae bacterium]